MANARLYVIVGLLGCGKTALARSMRCAYISFDTMWHSECQARGVNIAEFIQRLADRLNKMPDGNVVIDGWYTWFLDWQDTTSDESLEALQALIDRQIVVIRLHLPLKESERAHFKKKGKTRRAIVDAREKCLTERIERWAK